jgi:hypothetical protein
MYLKLMELLALGSDVELSSYELARTEDLVSYKIFVALEYECKPRDAGVCVVWKCPQTWY